MSFLEFTFWDLLDIFSVALIMYYVYKLTRGTQAPNIITGILVIYLLWVVVQALNMEMLSAILGQIIGVGVIALIIVFQPEIRRFLQVIGDRSRQRQHSFLGKLFDLGSGENKDVDLSYLAPIVKACTDMSQSKTGALIVIQRETDLMNVIETGIAVDAKITAALLKNIFFKNSPLHDGAVVIANSRIAGAKCVLPSTQSEVPVSFGMRHRAALGISELTDAIVLVVSEETGAISVAHNSQIKCGIAHNALHEEIMEQMIQPGR